ncbi:urease accessory protein UreD [Actinokineospora sp. NBRC 105648]|uniref:urease accessory protein UreD n=1 Tax=Actinokineospora sp. NBRC 105648 TaxID=3032206 RepID=UPI002554E752|nr:urease accessory protein UreD [Actinokineospora sp. NBRC 105648]
MRALHRDPHGARVGLIANGALLLSGDRVHVEIDVADGAWLEVVESTGTVAYRGEQPSSWTVDATVGDGAALSWGSLPFVVSDNATTHRGTRLRLHGTGRALLQEKIVLGRAGQFGGDIAMSLDAVDDSGPLQREHLDLSQPARVLPGILGRLRALDTVTALGWTPQPPEGLVAGLSGAGETWFPLDRSGSVFRWIGGGLFQDTLGDPTFTAWRAELLAKYPRRDATPPRRAAPQPPAPTLATRFGG